MLRSCSLILHLLDPLHVEFIGVVTFDFGGLAPYLRDDKAVALRVGRLLSSLGRIVSASERAGHDAPFARLAHRNAGPHRIPAPSDYPVEGPRIHVLDLDIGAICDPVRELVQRHLSRSHAVHMRIDDRTDLAFAAESSAMRDHAKENPAEAGPVGCVSLIRDSSFLSNDRSSQGPLLEYRV